MLRTRTTPPAVWSLPRARELWLWLHRWLGLTVGFATALIGLTGALLVVDGPLWRLEFPAIMAPLAPPSGGEPAPVADWIAAAQAARPDLGEPEFVLAAGVVPLPGEAAIVGRDVELDGGGTVTWSSRSIPGARGRWAASCSRRPGRGCRS